MRSWNIRPSRRILALGALMLAVCGGCSTQAQSAPTSTSPSTTLEITTTTVHYVPTYVTVGHRKVLMPVEAHNEPIRAYSNTGQNIIITKAGFEPDKLYALPQYPIVFTNLTDHTQVVKIYNFPNEPEPEAIPPGGKFSFRYDAQISLAYGNGSGTWHGHLYIDTLAGLS
jgi:hypothetical protein